MIWKRVILRPEFIVLILLLLITTQFIWRKKHWQDYVLSADGRGYYSYLTNAIIYQDVTWEENSKAMEDRFGFEFDHHYLLNSNNGNHFNKTFPGTAILMLPFFLIAYLLSYLSGLPLDGFNDLFLLFIQLGAITYATLGFHYFKKLLILNGIQPRYAILAAFGLLFGSNLYYYATQLPSLSHIYSFFLFAAFLYQIQKLRIINNGSKLPIVAFLFALILLTRPSNITIVLLAPFIFGIPKKFPLSLSENIKPILQSFLIFSIVILLLPIIWHIQTESYFIQSYGNEGFYWLHPKPLKVLFSFQNGAYLYAPLMLLSWLGIVNYSKKKPKTIVFGLIYFLINLYLISAWWMPTYSGGFGHRAMSEHFIFSGILLGFLLPSSSKLMRQLLILAIVTLSSFSIFQGYQMNKGILPSNYVDQKIYHQLWFKMSNHWIDAFHPIHDTRPFGKTIKIVDIPIVAHSPIIFDSTLLIGGEGEFSISDDPKHQYLLKISLLKHALDNNNFDHVDLCIHELNTDHEILSKKKYALYEYRYEGLENFAELKMEIHLQNHEGSLFKIFISNPMGSQFQIKSLSYLMEVIE